MIGTPRLTYAQQPLFLTLAALTSVILTSLDVIHGLSVPLLGLKADCVPGRSTVLSIQSSIAGAYVGLCSELCGTGHAYMPITLIFTEQEQLFSTPLSDLAEYIARRNNLKARLDFIDPTGTNRTQAGFGMYAAHILYQLEHFPQTWHWTVEQLSGLSPELQHSRLLHLTKLQEQSLATLLSQLTQVPLPSAEVPIAVTLEEYNQWSDSPDLDTLYKAKQVYQAFLSKQSSV